MPSWATLCSLLACSGTCGFSLCAQTNAGSGRKLGLTSGYYWQSQAWTPLCCLSGIPGSLRSSRHNPEPGFRVYRGLSGSQSKGREVGHKESMPCLSFSFPEPGHWRRPLRGKPVARRHSNGFLPSHSHSLPKHSIIPGILSADACCHRPFGSQYPVAALAGNFIPVPAS